MRIAKRWAVCLLLATPSLRAQSPVRIAPFQLTVGGDDENYLRYLQSRGLVSPYPWAIRPFAPSELARLAPARDSQPWTFWDSVPTARISVRALPMTLAARFNSSFPYGSNDGPIWAGRGLTSSIEGGIAIQVGPLSAILDPIAFRAENQSFVLYPNGQPGNLAFGDALLPHSIDHPQRFGSGAYARVDPGQSTVQLDLMGVSVGVSTADMGWGPMQEYEYITGGNAPGFPHIFAGTQKPANVFVGHLQARLIWGELEQSAYSPVQGTSYYSSALESGTRRFATGTVLVFEPRGIPGLELGAARFFHSLWPREGIPRSYLTKPLQGIFKKGLPQQEGLGQTGGSDNQLASAFARWVFPKSGFEFYGEYGREDHSWDRRDFVQEPDHSRTYGLGLRKVLGPVTAEGFSAIRAELIDYELPTLARNRSEGGVFVHSVIFQGHTNRGQLIGADAGVGTGGASSLIWERFGRNRKLSIGWSRTVRQENGVFYINGAENPRSVDVLHALNVEYLRESRGFELTTGASLAREFNRYFSSDATNFNTIVSIRRRFGR